MPMPHQTQMQLIKRRLVGKEGSERVRELRAILGGLPGYKNGPYGEIRKWVQDQIDETRVRAAVVHRDSIAVRREGAAQIALVGPPNAGKSSLLHALSQIQIKVGDYAFTTLRPVPALTRIHDVWIQLVEIPGLIAGATNDAGGGRALLGVLRGADAIVYCHDATAPIAALKEVQREVQAAGIALPSMLAATKMDDASEDQVRGLATAFPQLHVVPVSVLDDVSLDRLKRCIWELTGLVRVYLRRGNDVTEAAVPLAAGSTIRDVARAIHNDIEVQCRGALVWGPSARFSGQRVGRDHVVADGDMVEVLTR